MKESWKVDMSRLVEIVAERLYSDPIKAGIRELITNSLDARKDQVTIEIHYMEDEKKLRYSDDGIGIDPESFREVYGKIASGHERKKGSRGIFGLGRMALIAASKRGILISYKNGKVYEWKFNRRGWSGPRITKDLDEIGHGIYLEFEGLDLTNLAEIEEWIRKTFSLPLLKKECLIYLNHGEIFTSIQGPKFGECEEPIKTKYGRINLYTKEEIDGTLYICQKGILVREEPFTGITAYIDQDFLDIKTDREGFINNEKYRLFRKRLKERLNKFRPERSFKKMEIDFVKRLMREFKRYWFKKVKEKKVPIKIDLKFPESGQEIIKEDQSPQLDVAILSPKKVRLPEVAETSPVPVEVIPLPQETSVSEEKPSLNSNGIVPFLSEEKEKKVEEKKAVIIKGAKPVPLGEDYPMIFFESDPFVLVFNTSHPIFRKLVEKGKLGSSQLSVLFERMFNCAYLDKYPVESLEELKKRWKEVDSKLKEIFK